MKQQANSTPELITFDIFGTVLDWKSGLVSSCSAVGHPVSDEQFDAIIGVQSDIEKGAFLTYHDITARSLEMALGMDEATSQRVAATIGTWPFFADSQDALRSLMTIAPCAAMTNSDRLHGEQLQQRLGYRLSEWLCAEEARVYKPNPRFWHVMSQRSGVEAGADWWHVSAYADYDLSVANSLGLTTVFVQRPHSRPAPAVHSVRDLGELAALLTR